MFSYCLDDDIDELELMRADDAEEVIETLVVCYRKRIKVAPVEASLESRKQMVSYVLGCVSEIQGINATRDLAEKIVKYLSGESDYGEDIKGAGIFWLDGTYGPFCIRPMTNEMWRKAVEICAKTSY